LLDQASQELEDFIEQHSGDEGLLTEALTDKDTVTKTSVNARLKEVRDPEEKSVLKQAKKLFENETGLKKAIKEAQAELDLAVFKHYPQLSEREIKKLVVDDKWLASLKKAIEAEIERVTQQLANRVKELEQRYATPLPQLTQQVEELSSRVGEHLKKMGVES